MPKLPASFTPPPPDQVRALRLSLSKTQAELADALGVAARTVQKWESGETKISKMGWLALQTLKS